MEDKKREGMSNHMEKRLIDINPIISNLTAMKSMYDAIELDGMITALKDAPAVDAVAVVRCKDCMYWNDGSSLCTCNFDIMSGENFCSFGERRRTSYEFRTITGRS